MKERKINPVDIASYFFSKYRLNSSTEEVSKTAVIKMVYFAYAHYAEQENKELFTEPIRAWKQGPVIESVYDWLENDNTPRENTFSKELTSLFDAVFKRYGSFDKTMLTEITHNEDPFIKTISSENYNKYDKNSNVIDFNDIKDFYSKYITLD